MPGEIGTVIPKLETITLRHQDTIQHPRFSGRRLEAITDRKMTPAQLESGQTWFRRMRMGGFNAGQHGLGFQSEHRRFRPLRSRHQHRPRVSRAYRTDHLRAGPGDAGRVEELT